MEKPTVNGITTKTLYNNKLTETAKSKNAGTSAESSIIVKKG